MSFVRVGKMERPSVKISRGPKSDTVARAALRESRRVAEAFGKYEQRLATVANHSFAVEEHLARFKADLESFNVLKRDFTTLEGVISYYGESVASLTQNFDILSKSHSDLEANVIREKARLQSTQKQLSSLPTKMFNPAPLWWAVGTLTAVVSALGYMVVS